MALATLSIDLVAQLAKLQSGMDQAARVAERSASQIEARWAKLQNVASALGVAFGGALSVAGVAAFFRSTVDGIDRLNDLADATGASIETLSALEDVAARTGTSVDTVGDAVVKLNKVLGEAKADNDAGRALQAIGLNAQQLKELDPAQALQRVAKALALFADDGNKARLIQELFGKSVREVAPLLKDLAEGGELAAKVTSQQAAEAERLNKELFSLQKNSTDAARSLVSELVPALNRLFDRSRSEGVLASLFTPSDSAQQLTKAVEAQNELTQAQRRFERALALSTRDDLPGSARAKYADEAKQLRIELEAVQQRALKATQAVKEALGQPDASNYSNEGRNRPRPSVRVPAGPTRPPAAPRRELAPPVDPAMVEALAAIQQTDAVKVEQLNAALDRLFAIRASGLGGDASVDQAIERLRNELSKLDPAQQAAAESAARLKQLLAATPTANYQAVLDDIDLLNKALEEGRIKATDSKTAIELWAEAVSAATQRLPKSADEISEFAREAARNVQDALGDSVLATLEGRTRSIADVWRRMLDRMVAEAVAANLAKKLLGDDFGKTGSVGGPIGKGIDWLKQGGGSGIGDAIGKGIDWLTSFGGFRAAGGPVAAGVPYIVGERGPELMVPRSAGTVVPNSELPTAKPAAGATYVVNVQGDASPNTVRLIQQAMAQFEARQALRQRF